MNDNEKRENEKVDAKAQEWIDKHGWPMGPVPPARPKMIEEESIEEESKDE